jgi:hypothetical protein
MIASMTAVVERQITQGRFISRHVRGNAVDILLQVNTREHQAAFQNAVDLILGPGHWISEEDHYHVQF